MSTPEEQPMSHEDELYEQCKRLGIENEQLAVQVAQLQKRIAELEGALKLARGHIISHHAARLNGGELGWCPVCHKEDGTELELDAIDKALKGGAR